MFPSGPPAGVSRQPAGVAGGALPGAVKSQGWNVEFGWWGRMGGSVFKSTSAGKE